MLQERLCNMENAHDPLYVTTADKMLWLDSIASTDDIDWCAEIVWVRACDPEQSTPAISDASLPDGRMQVLY